MVNDIDRPSSHFSYISLNIIVAVKSRRPNDEWHCRF